MCLLKEVFDAFPKTPMHLDMKFTSDELVHKTFDMIDKYDRRGLTILGAASGPNVKLLRAVAQSRYQEEPRKGRYLTFASFPEVVKTYLLYAVGLLPFFPPAFDAFSIPLPTKAKQSMFAKRNLGPPLVRKCALWLLHSPALWRHLRRQGISVIGFVLNDKEEWTEVEGWPIDGVMTDDPVGYRKYLNEGSKEKKKVD